MELKIRHLKSYFLLILLGVSFSVFAQTKNDDRDLLLGKWMFEEAYLHGFKEEISLDLYNSYTDIYSEIEVSKDTIVLTDNEYNKVLKVKYEVSKNYLGIEFSSGKTIITEWTIFDDKLYIEYSLTDLKSEAEKATVLLIYKHE